MPLGIQNYGEWEGDKPAGHHPPACTCYRCNEGRMRRPSRAQASERTAAQPNGVSAPARPRRKASLAPVVWIAAVVLLAVGSFILIGMNYPMLFSPPQNADPTGVAAPAPSGESPAIAAAIPTPTPTPASASPAPTVSRLLAKQPTYNFGAAAGTSVSPTPAPWATPTALPTPTTTTAPAPTAWPTRARAPETTPAAVNLNDLYGLMLDRINRERQAAGVPPVRLGSNPAAQLHAEHGLQNCILSHWDQWGLKPNHRYSLAGGTGAEAENVAGTSSCIRGAGSSRYTKIASREAEVSEHMEGWMNSPGHRRTILNPAWTRVNLGMAFTAYQSAMVQQFDTDYVTFTTRPSIDDKSVLRAEGTVSNASLSIGRTTIFQITHHPPPETLTRGQLAHTYSTCPDPTIGSLLKPAPRGTRYPAGSFQAKRTYTQNCVNPYRNDPAKPGPKSPEEAHAAWELANELSGSGLPKTDSWERVVASRWNVSGDKFSVKADISSLTDRHGPGIYTLFIWGRPNHMSKPAALSEQAIFWRTEPPEGHPYN